jgi:hypothetical protein
LQNKKNTFCRFPAVFGHTKIWARAYFQTRPSHAPAPQLGKNTASDKQTAHGCSASLWLPRKRVGGFEGARFLFFSVFFWIWVSTLGEPHLCKHHLDTPQQASPTVRIEHATWQ